MNGWYEYIKLLWNLILYYDYGMNSCVSYAEAGWTYYQHTLLACFFEKKKKMTVKQKGGWHVARLEIVT